MRHLVLIAPLLVVAGIHGWELASAAGSASLRISGYVAPAISTSVSTGRKTIPLAAVENFQPGLDNGIELAELVSRSNLSTGYQVQLASENGGRFGDYSYQVSLNGSRPIPLTRPGVPVHVSSGSRSPGSSHQSIRLIPARNPSGVEPKSLTDTLTLSIIAQ